VFDGLSPPYGALLVDPPWYFEDWSKTPHTQWKTDRATQRHYETMSIDDILRLPVASLAAPDCALFLWVIDSHLNKAFEIGTAWGFTYKTRAFEWLKTGTSGYRVGLGYWTRKQCESVLLFTRGSPRRKSKAVRQIIEAPRREHSRKPDEVYERIEALVDGPYCELFARRHRPGWQAWGKDLL
jgi:N6-adenosine-specific RNA methylase IME4